MKSFGEQFRECIKQKLVGHGDFLRYDQHPELLPFCPTKHKKLISKYKNKGFYLNKCLRFGGVCSSAHKGCQKLRGMSTIHDPKR